MRLRLATGETLRGGAVSPSGGPRVSVSRGARTATGIDRRPARAPPARASETVQHDRLCFIANHDEPVRRPGPQASESGRVT